VQTLVNTRLRGHCYGGLHRGLQEKGIESKCTEAKEAASRNDIRSLYGVVRQLTGAKDNTNVPIVTKDGRLLLTESEQNLRWKEHFEEVLN